MLDLKIKLFCAIVYKTDHCGGNSYFKLGSSFGAGYKNGYPVNRIPNQVEPIRAPIGSVFLKVDKVVVADPDPGFSNT